MKQRRVEDEGLRARKLLSSGNKKVIVPLEEETANSVPAAAVIQRSRALGGITGLKACVGGSLSTL